MRLFGALAIAVFVVGGMLAVLFLRPSQPMIASAPPDAAIAKRTHAPAGSAFEKAIHFELAVYHLSPPRRPPDEIIRELVATRLPWLHIGGAAPSLSTRHPPLLVYSPPDPRALEYFGIGIGVNDADRLQHAPAITVVDFHTTHDLNLRTLRAADELMLALAEATDGLIWDDDTRQIFAPVAWKSRRLDGWKAAAPNIRTQVAIHAYPDSELVRSITLGMKKFGLPDIVVEQHTRNAGDAVGQLINLTCETLLERGELAPGGKLTVRGKQGVADLELLIGEKQRGDSDNRLWEIGFGESATQAQDAILAAVLGSEEHLTLEKHGDAELQAASARARARLPVIRGIFKRGLGASEALRVKAPFRTRDDGTEWMWVEVTQWKKGKIYGVLINDPYYVDELKAGAKVVVDESDLFDYSLLRADGTEDGNETTKILMRREADRQKRP